MKLLNTVAMTRMKDSFSNGPLNSRKTINKQADDMNMKSTLARSALMTVKIVSRLWSVFFRCVRMTAIKKPVTMLIII